MVRGVDFDGGQLYSTYKTIYGSLSLIIVGMIVIITMQAFNVIGFLGGGAALLLILFCYMLVGSYGYYSLAKYARGGWYTGSQKFLMKR